MSGKVAMEIRSKFWIERRGEVVIGSGKTALLMAIERLGSIQGAADEFGMSYRHAWGAIKRIEKRAGFTLVETRLGGREAGARLTAKGKVFVMTADALFKDLRDRVQKRSQQKWQSFARFEKDHHAPVGK